MLLKRKYLFGTTILAGVMAVTAPAFAQTAPALQEPEATEIGEVVVTGSRIRRDPTTAPTPLIQVSRETLLATGQTTVIDYLATIPALVNSQVPSDTTGGALGALGLSLPNLRTLGAGRTLTLVDGRRHVGSAIGSLAVDVDTIPRLLIENIEIVTGGAASVYGADAVSGVLNFVMRKDFEGLEIDGNYGIINKGGGEATKRLSVLAGVNLFDDRLNLYVSGEIEEIDEVNQSSLEFMTKAWGLVGNDADPAGTSTSDGVLDLVLLRDLRTMQIRFGGQLTIANGVRPSPTNDPDVPNVAAGSNCVAANGPLTADCFNPRPGLTYVFDATGLARLADFGLRVTNTGRFQSLSIGGDGSNPSSFNRESIFPQSESQRYQAGLNFALTDSLNLRAEYKYVIEDSFQNGGPAFSTVFFTNDFPVASQATPVLDARTSSPTNYLTRLDNAFLPPAVLAQLLTNQVQPFGNSTATLPGAPLAPFAAAWGRYTAWVQNRPQTNTRELNRYVISADGTLPDIGFIKNINFDVGYTRGTVDNQNTERPLDGQRYGFAIDSVRDTTGVLGTVGAIVCRVRLLTAGGATIANQNTGAAAGTPGALSATSPEVAQCQPYNIFGEGVASQAATNYVTHTTGVVETNEQQDFIASISGTAGDYWGAGPIGFALGYEARTQETTGTGRTRTTQGRWLLSNIGDDWGNNAKYDTSEFFAELAVPLFRDSWLGTYAELSGSYRLSDFSTTGESDVYGVNLVYRPIPDLVFKTSFNTSVRTPDLGEQFGPRVQTFALLTDPCDAAQIALQSDLAIRANRIANCTAQATAAGLGGVFTFSDPNALDAFRPIYTSSVSGALAGNLALKPETSESFTFSAVYSPPIVPGLNIVLDYYEISIKDVLATVSGQTSANLCVNGPSLNGVFCNVITRSPVDLPAPNDQRFLIVDFLQASFNFAKRETRGLDFTVNYSADLEEITPWSLGRISASVRGSWLIEQKNFNNIANPADFTESAATQFFPRVRMTSSLSYSPNDRLTATWSVDWQSAQVILFDRNQVNNVDSRNPEFYDTGNFTRHDLAFRYAVRDDLDLRFGVTNLMNAEQAPWLGTGLNSQFDPYGRRFNVGFNYRPY